MHSTHTIALPDNAPLLLGATPLVMGIVNVTPDSFSDGGLHDRVDAAVTHALRLVEEGAAIIDVGGESTRPGASPVAVQDELDRVMPVITALRGNGITVPISIDTSKPLVADQAIQAGASIINDVHGLLGDKEMADVAALYDVPVIAMHWQRDGDSTLPLRDAMRRYFDAVLARAAAAGLKRNRLVLDPGFGFGKSLAQNYAILRELRQYCATSDGAPLPILVGTSRKSMIGRVLDVPPDQRLAGTLASNVLGYANGGHIFRVHDVRAHRDALRVAQATLYGPPAQLE